MPLEEPVGNSRPVLSANGVGCTRGSSDSPTNNNNNRGRTPCFNPYLQTHPFGTRASLLEPRIDNLRLLAKMSTSLSLSVSLSLYVCLNVCLPVCPCHPASISLSARVAPSIRILWFYMYICVYMLIWDSRLPASACLFVIFLCHKIRPIVCLSGYQSLSVYLSLSLSVSLTTTPGS